MPSEHYLCGIMSFCMAYSLSLTTSTTLVHFNESQPTKEFLIRAWWL